MKFSDYSKRLYPHMSGLHNQSHFVGSLFNAAGSTFFPVRGVYGADDNQRKVYSGSRVLNKNIKASFPSPIDSNGVAVFFDTHIGDTSLPLIMAEFGIPNDEAQSKELFINALCIQFQSIIAEAANDVEDIVAREYSRLLLASGTEAIKQFPLYPNDAFTLIGEYPAVVHTVGFYNDFEHRWTLKNTGTVTWEGRFFECVNHSTTRIKALNTAIGIPKVQPNEEVSIVVRLNARGFEGLFESIWVMKDGDGRLCFPDEEKTLKFSVKVENRGEEQAEVCNG